MKLLGGGQRFGELKADTHNSGGSRETLTRRFPLQASSLPRAPRGSRVSDSAKMLEWETK